MGRDNVLFTFPSVSLAHPHASSASGFLVLSSSSRPTEHDPRSRETHLRLQHTPESKGNSTDVEIEAWRELRKISPREFVLGTEFGDLSIKFPELHHLIPQNDARIDLPTEVKREMTWEGIVREFESEVDHFVSYKKNTYSLIDSPFSGTAAASEKGGMEKSRGYESGKHHGYESGKSHGYNSEKGHGYESEKGKRIDNDRALQAYDPSNFRAGDEKRGGGRLVLVDEENGHEVGEVRGSQVDSIGVVPGSKDPVEITFPVNGEGGPVTIRPADYLKDSAHPAYQNSTIVQTAATASRLIVTSASYVSNAMITGARTFQEKTKPNEVPTTFQPTTHQRFQQVHTLSSTAAKFSSATVGKVSTIAQNAGAKLVGKDKEATHERGKPRNPNIINKSLIAFSTVADGIDYASKSLLNSGSVAATQIVTHKYGAEAGGVAHAVTGSFKNVGLVYIDASGVSRRAVVKGVAKGMVVGKVKGGGEVMVPTGSNQGYDVDGLPPGWGDGPLGGANAGPPPMYDGGPIHGSNVYYPPPRTPSPGYGKGGKGNGDYKF